MPTMPLSEVQGHVTKECSDFGVKIQTNSFSFVKVTLQYFNHCFQLQSKKIYIQVTFGESNTTFAMNKALILHDFLNVERL